MKLTIYRLLPLLLLVYITTACTSTDKAAKKGSSATPDEYIFMNINEAEQFKFVKKDHSWTGSFTTFTLDENNEKIEKTHFTVIQDSTWQDFEPLVQYLNLYEMPPQNEINDWVPDSGTLPSKVYSFEVFNGNFTHTFSYQDPLKEVKDFWQSARVATFFTFIQNDLKWKPAE